MLIEQMVQRTDGTVVKEQVVCGQRIDGTEVKEQMTLSMVKEQVT